MVEHTAAQNRGSEEELLGTAGQKKNSMLTNDRVGRTDPRYSSSRVCVSMHREIRTSSWTPCRTLIRLSELGRTGLGLRANIMKKHVFFECRVARGCCAYARQCLLQEKGSRLTVCTILVGTVKHL